MRGSTNFDHKKLAVYGKLVMTVILTYFIIWNSEWSQVWTTVQNVKLTLAGFAFILVLLSVVISAYKWQLILTVHDIRFDFGRLNAYYFTATFINNFLPSTIGGDGYRIYKTLNNPVSKHHAVIAVIVERVSGIAALLFLAYVSSFFDFMRTHNLISKTVLVLGTIVICLTVISIASFSRFSRWHVLPRKEWLAGTVKRVLAVRDDYLQKPKKTIGVLLISLLFQMHLLFIYWLTLHAFGGRCSIFSLLLVMALTNLIAIIPLSFNGIGLMDGAFIYFSSLYGVSQDSALAVMVLFRIMLLIISVIGGVLYVLEKLKGEGRPVPITTQVSRPPF